MTDSSLVSSGRRVSGMITVPEFKKIKSLVVQKSQVQDLEEKANRGYEALKVFFETEKLACISEVAEGYENLRDSLFVLTGRAKFLRWERTMAEATFLDRYILQYVVGSTGMEAFAGDLRHYHQFQQLFSTTQELERIREPHDTLSPMIIQNELPYYSHVPIVAAFIKGYRTDLVVKAMDDIRERYPMPFGAGK